MRVEIWVEPIHFKLLPIFDIVHLFERVGGASVLHFCLEFRLSLFRRHIWQIERVESRDLTDVSNVDFELLLVGLSKDVGGSKLIVVIPSSS